MSAQCPQPSRAWLARSLLVRLECLALDLRECLNQHTSNKQRTTSSERRVREVIPGVALALAKGYAGGLADCEQVVCRVEDSVECSDRAGSWEIHVFLADEQLPDDLLHGCSNSHAEECETIGGELKGVDKAIAGVCGRTLSEGVAAEEFDDCLTGAVEEDVVLYGCQREVD